MNMLGKNVTMICHNYAPFPAGGQDRQAQGVAEILARQGWNMRILTKRRSKETKPREILNGVSVRRLFNPLIPKIEGALFLANVFWGLFTGPRHQIIHLNQMYREILSALLVKRLRGSPVVICVSCGGAYGDIARLNVVLFGRQMLRLSRRADAVISLSDQITEELHKAGFDPGRIVKIPNAVDTSRYVAATAEERQQLREQLHLPQSGPLVIFTGRLHFQKAIDRLIRAWQAVFAAQPQAALLILGEGQEEAMLRQLASDLKLTDSIHFLGHIEGVLPYLRASDVFVLPSLFEGVSLSLLEAMACGMPVVTTNIGGTREVIRDNLDGLLVEPDDVPGLAARLNHVLADPVLRQRVGEQARKRVEELYGLAHSADCYADLYERLASHQPMQPAGAPTQRESAYVQ